MILLLGSCISEITETVDKIGKIDAIKWNPTIAVPLVYSRLNLQDFLDDVDTDQYLRIEDDGSMTLVYTDSYESDKAEDVLSLNDQSFSETFTLTPSQLSTLNTSNSVTINLNRTLGYDFGSNEIDRLLLKQGSFDLEVSTTLEHDVTFSIRILEAKTGTTVFEPTVVANSTTLPNVGTTSENLSGLEIDFTQTAQGHSEMDVEISMVIAKRGSNAIKPVETITYSAAMINQAFGRVDGLFGILDFSTAGDTLKIPFFENNSGGSFTLADPRIKFVLTNSAGATINANVLQFDGINAQNNTVSLTGFPSPLPMPSLDFSEVGFTKKDSFELNRNTSNLADYVNNRPAKNVYVIDVKSTNAGTRQWLLDTSRVAARIEIEVPLEGTARDFVLESSQPFTLDFDNVSDIKEVLFRMYTENGFPVDIATQLYFEDSISNTILDSLITTDILILPSAGVDAQGKVVSVNPKTTDITLGTANITNIENANRIRIKATLNTLIENGSQPDVKFFNDYDLLLQFGVQAEVLIEQRLDQ